MSNVFFLDNYLSAPYKTLISQDALGVTCCTTYISKITPQTELPMVHESSLLESKSYFKK